MVKGWQPFARTRQRMALARASPADAPMRRSRCADASIPMPLRLPVPVITALGSLVWRGEPLTATFGGASILTRSGVAVTLRRT